MIQYRGPAVDAGTLSFADLDVAATGAVELVHATGDVLARSAGIAKDAFSCTALATTRPRLGCISVSFEASVDGNPSPDLESAIEAAIYGSISR